MRACAALTLSLPLGSAILTTSQRMNQAVAAKESGPEHRSGWEVTQGD
jgi:hypothetical protein